ncbi:MAG: tetratricopeptide repeat protein [Candidatus Palauibacterales bacterium]|nr:tetratricopeptide repeat protein [Candidatus Palauibacterales bacterium]MDP2482618.1 tetratricopeptide repeat protein [Candidatus Palauibacterales bacterium]
MANYSTGEVAEVLGLSQERVRRLAASADLHPERPARGWYRFEFRDLVLLRAALELEKSGVSPRRLLRSLRDLKRQLPADRPLTAIRITLEADELVVQDEELAWNPESGQVQLGLRVDDSGADVEPLDRRRARPVTAERRLKAEDWYELGCGLQAGSPDQAMEAFRRAVELDAGLSDAHVNLGVLLHERSDLEGAEVCYRLALRADPQSATAAYNLGVVLEDMGKPDEATEVYRRAIECDPLLADAYYNLSRLYERAGDRAAALRHLRSYSELVKIN